VVFRKFVEFGSARQVLLWLRHHEIRLPTVAIADGRELSWRLPVYQTIIKFIRNPIYAGAYAFGRTETHTRVLEGRAHKVRGYRRAREQWTVLLAIIMKVISGGKTMSAISGCSRITRR
jgi:hypothetical protein